MSRSLEGKRIVITRGIEQARDLKERLEHMGAAVLLFPSVGFSEAIEPSRLDRAIHALGECDWILFTSANAVRFFAGRCRKLGVEPKRGGNYRCAAVGPATASAVAAEGFSADYVAREFVGTALAGELSAWIAGKKIVLPRSDRARPDLPNALRAAGAEVADVVAYHTGGAGAIDPEVMRAICEARVDIVSFFSPSAIENMRVALGAEVFSRLGAKAAFAAVGPVTAEALRNEGLQVAIEAPLTTAESMAAAIEKYVLLNGETKARVV
jgi:uroporphyrinogen-III synthase